MLPSSALMSCLLLCCAQSPDPVSPTEETPAAAAMKASRVGVPTPADPATRPQSPMEESPIAPDNIDPPGVLQPPRELPPIVQHGKEPAAENVLPLDPSATVSADEPPTTEVDPPDVPLPPAPTEQSPMRPTPPVMVADALTLAPGGEPVGRGLSLLGAVSSVTDRQGHLDAVHAYWRSTEAVAKYQYALRYDAVLARLAQTSAAGQDIPLPLQTAQGVSAAQLQDAKVALINAQHELAVAARLPLDAALPLPSDHPHVGKYRTNFHQLYSTRPAPAKVRLIDRTLPLLAQAVDRRSEAVHAAAGALTAALEHRDPSAATLTSVLDRADRYRREQEAFMVLVCRYNHHIADYALTVAGPRINRQTLVAMLVKPSRAQARPLIVDTPPTGQNTGTERPAVESTGFDQPVLTPTPQRDWTPAVAPRHDSLPNRRVLENPLGARSGGRPTLAPPRDEQPKSMRKEPTLAPVPKEAATPAASDSVNPDEPETNSGMADSQSTKSTSHITRRPADETWSPMDGQPDPSVPEDDTPVAQLADGSPAAPYALHASLIDADANRQTRELCISLHWDRTLPPDLGEPMTLAECLRDGAWSRRNEVINAYWLLRQRAAEYQALVEEAGWIETVALFSGDTAPTDKSEDVVAIRLAQSSTEAAILEAHASLIGAQFELAQRMGRSGNSSWPMATTVPLTSDFRLPAQDRQTDSWPLRRLRATLPGLEEAIRRHAATVVRADTDRASATADYVAGRYSVERVLEHQRLQTEQSFALLRTLTAYNRATAQFAVAVLPRETSVDTLAATLTPSG